MKKWFLSLIHRFHLWLRPSGLVIKWVLTGKKPLKKTLRKPRSKKSSSKTKLTLTLILTTMIPLRTLSNEGRYLTVQEERALELTLMECDLAKKDKETWKRAFESYDQPMQKEDSFWKNDKVIVGMVLLSLGTGFYLGAATNGLRFNK